MSFWKKDDGATLMELIVSFAVGALVVAAVSAVLLVGFRIHNHTTKVLKDQYNARMLLNTLEDIASEGAITKVETLEDGSWKLKGKAGTLFSYDAAAGEIFSGDGANLLMTDLQGASIALDGNMITFSIQDRDKTFSSSVYCRTVYIRHEDEQQPEEAPPTPEQIIAARAAFVKMLLTQGGRKGGTITYVENPAKPDDYSPVSGEPYKFYSEWYIGGYDEEAEAGHWGPDTPWCGCFISWVLAHTDVEVEAAPNNGKWYANVQDFLKHFKGEYRVIRTEQPAFEPQPGDLIFFNLDDDADADHMGAVISTDKDYIYTIEGNYEDAVAFCSYARNDADILAYGILQWGAGSGN